MLAQAQSELGEGGSNNKKPEKSLRRIYTNVPYTEKEQNWLVEFKTLIAKHPENKIPDYWNDGLNLAFVYSTECQIEKAYKRMIDYLKWYNDYFPMNIQPEDKAIKLLNKLENENRLANKEEQEILSQ